MYTYPIRLCSIDDNRSRKEYVPDLIIFGGQRTKGNFGGILNMPGLEELEFHFLVRVRRRNSIRIYILDCVKDYELR